MDSSLDILAIEPWLGGSHEQFLRGFERHSRHSLQIVGLPARHWQWRMDGSAYPLAQRILRGIESGALRRPHALLVSDYLDLPRLRGFLPPSLASLPALLYFHENQLTYPQSETDRTHSAHHGFTNILSCLAAQAIVFNSQFHREEFTAAASLLLHRLPQPSPKAAFSQAIERAHVIYPGIESQACPLSPGPPAGSPLRLAFNHRWEHDKDPCAFLDAVCTVRGRGYCVDVVILGQQFEATPPDWVSGLAALTPPPLQQGFAPERSDYLHWLGQCDFAVSTALHEFYGMSILEALACGCSALAPYRLAYPEVLSKAALYTSHTELIERLVHAAQDPAEYRTDQIRASNHKLAQTHNCVCTAQQLDEILHGLHARTH